MRTKRIKRHNGKPVMDSPPALDPSVEKMAAMLVKIAGMDALPLASSQPLRRRRRRCAT
jgi:hypothetical protein